MPTIVVAQPLNPARPIEPLKLDPAAGIVGYEEMKAHFLKLTSENQNQVLSSYAFSNNKREELRILGIPVQDRTPKQKELIEALVREAVPNYWREQKDADEACEGFKAMFELIRDDPNRYMHWIKAGAGQNGGSVVAAAATVTQASKNSSAAKVMLDFVLTNGAYEDVAKMLKEASFPDEPIFWRVGTMLSSNPLDKKSSSTERPLEN